MKKQILAGVSAAVMMLGATAANAVMCVDFVGYCDGMEVDVQGGKITGTWLNTDCAGASVPVAGRVVPGGAQVASQGLVGGYQWGWDVDTPLDGTMDMYQNSPPWTMWIDEMVYSITPGSCLFGGPLTETGGIPSTSRR